MSDYNNLPNKYNNKNVQVFISAGYASGVPYATPQMWHKPLGITMVHILAIGAGGGGGNGRTRASLFAANAYGGGGGGAGGLTSLLISASLIPNELFVYVAQSTPAGTAGGPSSVYIQRLSTSSNTKSVLVLANGGSNGGTGNTTAGNAGNGGSAMSINSMPAASGGTFTTVAGTAGAAGQNANGSDINWLSAATYGTGGGGGAGTTSGFDNTMTGGRILTPAWTISIMPPPMNRDNIPGGAATGGDGLPGYFMMQPFLATGGSGAANSPASGTGGRGGNGGVGCGGGGGGQGVTGGAGGMGGPGLVIITCW